MPAPDLDLADRLERSCVQQFEQDWSRDVNDSVQAVQNPEQPNQGPKAPLQQPAAPGSGLWWPR